ncbi:MAG: response regulator [Oceanococcaceae bacterium]
MTMPASTVLIADDEDNMLVSLEVLFTRAGFDVRLARDGHDAFAQAQNSVPDLILLDVMMPGRDGFSVCQALRADPRFAHTPIIMLTAKAREADRVKGLTLGASDYLTKPFSTRELLARANALLKRTPG